MLTFLNAALFVGFAALAIPPIVHLLSRKRYDEVDWAAMQFLQVSNKTRRKVFIEHFLLMLLRMLAVACLVAAFSAPVLTSYFLNQFGKPSGQRDLVILIDGSASMSFAHDGRTGQDAAKDWVNSLLDTLSPGDRVAVYQARQQAVALLGNFSTDLPQARNSLELLAEPRGGVDWPACTQTAFGVLERGRPDRELVIVSDNQFYSWADENTLAKWELIGKGTDGPRVWVVNVAPDRPVDPMNITLDPILAGRGIASAGREVNFRSALRFGGSGPRSKLPELNLEIDGRIVGPIPVSGNPANGLIPIQFTHKYTVGSHLVSIVFDKKTAEGTLPGHDRQDFAIEVLPSVPVLIIDGDLRANPPYRGGDFLRDALAPAKDPAPSFLVKAVTLPEFTPTILQTELKGQNTAPRVVILSNIGKLSKDQNEAIEKFLIDGGAVWVTLGDRVDAAAWNRTTFRGGQGWLPARLTDIIGNAAADVNLNEAPKPLTSGLVHPALDLFKEPLPLGLQTAYFPKRWKVDTEAGANGNTGTVIATLTNGDPFLVERGVGRGRVILCTVPLDNSWRTNFVTLPDFVRFAHELCYYLAGARSAERNLAPGQPIVFFPRPEEPPGTVTVEHLGRLVKTVVAKSWPLIYDATRDPGVYRLTTAGGRNFYYAVRTDPQEALLTPASADDRDRVASSVPNLKYIKEPSEIDSRNTDAAQSREVWWLVLIGVLTIYLLELFYSRRIALRG